MAIEESEHRMDGMRAYGFSPESPTKAGVLVLPTHGGADRYNRDSSQILARAGFHTLLWDPYPHLESAPELLEDRRRLMAGVRDEWAIGAQSRWLTYMQEELGVERLACVGFCMGGRYALILAGIEHRLAALVSYYPSVRRPMLQSQEYDAVALATEIRCPVTLIWAKRDHVTTWEISSEIQQNLQGRDQPTATLLLPNAEHGFVELGEPVEDIKLSWVASLDFLKTYL